MTSEPVLVRKREFMRYSGDISQMKPDSASSAVILVMVLSAFILTGCSTSNHQASIDKIERSSPGSVILLMPIDIELSLQTAGGISEPHAEWTRTARSYLNESMREFFSSHDLILVEYERPAESDPRFQHLIELERLHGEVGKAIIHHKYQMPLPSKKETFDWTLGKTARELRQQNSEADYALFVQIRDTYSSTGRILVRFGAALFGVSIPVGQKIRLASLVDLNSGNVVWFNYLSHPVGDLRDKKPAQSTVGRLLESFPV